MARAIAQLQLSGEVGALIVSALDLIIMIVYKDLISGASQNILPAAQNSMKW